MNPRQVLIIDDHRESADMLATLLRLRNRELAVQVAYDGESALPLALATQHDVVIVDLNLPGIGGEEVATLIRRKWVGVPPLLVALSGNVADIARHQGGGVFEHALTKPVNLARLMDILVSHQ